MTNWEKRLFELTEKLREELLNLDGHTAQVLIDKKVWGLLWSIIGYVSSLTDLEDKPIKKVFLKTRKN